MSGLFESSEVVKRVLQAAWTRTRTPHMRQNSGGKGPITAAAGPTADRIIAHLASTVLVKSEKVTMLKPLTYPNPPLYPNRLQ
jgi:hypothetical protein